MPSEAIHAVFFTPMPHMQQISFGFPHRILQECVPFEGNGPLSSPHINVYMHRTDQESLDKPRAPQPPVCVLLVRHLHMKRILSAR